MTVSSSSETLRASDRARTGSPRVMVFMEASEFGGPAKNLVATSKLLAGSVDFRVVTFIRGDTPSTEFIDQLAAEGIGCDVIRERYRYDPRGLRDLRQIVKAHRPDIVQIHNGKSRLYLYILRRLGALGTFQTIDCYHGETWTDAKQLIYNKIDRWLFRRAQHVIVVSKRQERLLEAFGVPLDRITVIYNGIRLRPSSPRSAGDPLRVVTIGRMSREKGHANLAAAVRLLRERYNHVRFTVTVVGDGPEMKPVRESIAHDGLAGTIELAGYQPDPTPYYENADLFVLPSLSEGIPNVLLEAAIHHVPIVSTNVGGVPEMFDDGVEALLVPPGDVEALANAMGRCLGDAALRRRLATAARDKVERRFTDDHRAEEYLKYYRSLMRSEA